MTCATDALKRDRDRARRTDLNDEIDAADIDAEFERSGGDERAEFAGFQFIFDRETALARKAAVVRGDGVIAENFARDCARRVRRGAAC